MTFTAPPTPPTSRPPSPDVQAGAAIFESLGCAQCHQPAFQTGPSSSPALSRVTFFPFSDFLLHDMGTLGDGIPQGSATPTQMRTAPLWGLRYEKTFLTTAGPRTSTRRSAPTPVKEPIERVVLGAERYRKGPAHGVSAVALNEIKRKGIGLSRSGR